MAGADSFQFFLKEVIDEIRDINEKLAVVGLYFLGKIAIKSLCKIYSGSRTYLIPMVFSNDKWIKSLGDWAIVTGYFLFI